MAEYLTNDTDLKVVADAIRAKAGSTAQLSFPNGFVTAVNEIQTGGGGGGTCTVTLTCEASDSKLAYFSPDCVFHIEDLQAGANVFQVLQKSPICVVNAFNYALTDLVNMVNTRQMVYMGLSYNNINGYTIYYATASTASATQQTE